MPPLIHTYKVTQPYYISIFTVNVQIFLDPTHDERKAKMPAPGANQSVIMSSDDAIAAAAALVVDAAVTFQGSNSMGTSKTQMRLNASGRLVTDPISYNSDDEDNGIIEQI